MTDVLRRGPIALAGGATLLCAGTVLAQGWVNFANETGSRLVAASGIGSADPEEKDFAYADFDNDGDIDLIVVRKQPFTVPTGKRNVLLMNEGGVLVDRTTEFAKAADDGGQGFFDITNDRDVAIGDFNNDGWLDFVTCPALNQNLAKTISHPRVYMNLGDNGAGGWAGFRYEEARIPQMPQAPNGCGIAVGDVTGDGWVDIYVVDYNSSQEDRLLVNLGGGVFADQTASRLSPTMISSGFGTAGFIGDINGDGVNDIAKSENGPFKTTYNNPAAEGFFNKHETTSGGAHYGMSAGDLNNDGKIDFVLGDDGSDRYLLNTGNGPDGMADFESKTFSFQSGGDDGFGNNSRIVDLNLDGWNDVLIADVDVDIGGCTRRLHFYRNLGNAPSVTLQDQGTAGIPAAQLTGTHDVAVFDINGDGWKDLVIGRCSGLSVWMNQPPIGLSVAYPQGLPATLVPEADLSFQVKFNVIGASNVVPGTETLFVRDVADVVTSYPLIPLGNSLYSATLPATPCTEVLDWWVSTQLSPGGTVTDPPTAPLATYTALSALGTEIVLREEFEASIVGWTVQSDAAVGVSGSFVAADPNGTAVAGGIAAPEDDATSGDAFVAFVTGNGPPGAAAGAWDVDFGTTRLISPTIDLGGQDAIISYAAWVFCDDPVGSAQNDPMYVEVSNDGGVTYWLAMTVTDTNHAWKVQTFRVSDFVAPSSNVKVRFSIGDPQNNSITEGGVDNFQVELVLCPSACPGDLDGSGAVDGADLGDLLAAWGNGGNADLNDDGVVDGADLGELLSLWGPCS